MFAVGDRVRRLDGFDRAGELATVTRIVNSRRVLVQWDAGPSRPHAFFVERFELVKPFFDVTKEWFT